MIARTSFKVVAPPVANICMATLPRAAPSLGPARTVLPVASAVNWLSKLFFDPPPMTRIRSMRRPVSVSRLERTRRYLNARLSRIARA